MQLHPVRIPHAVTPMLLQPLVDMDDGSVDIQEWYIGALPNADDVVR